MEKKLQRDEQNKTIAGVCAGLAEYLSVDVALVRVLFVLAMVLHGCGLGLYIILWIVMPKKTFAFNKPGFGNAGPVDYTVPPQSSGPIDYSVPNPFGNFTGAPFEAGKPFVAAPKKASTASIIIGAALVAFGAFFLLDNFDLIPDWDLDRLWPLVFVAAGIVLVVSSRRVNPWEKKDWHLAEEPATEAKAEDKTEDTPPAI